MKKLLTCLLFLPFLAVVSCGEDDDNDVGLTRLPAEVRDIHGDRFMSAVLAEFDGNPGVDLMLGGLDREGIGKDVLLFNDGNGNFEIAPEANMPDRYGTPDYGTVSLRAGDFDNDGDNDVLAAVHGPLPSEDATVMLYFNDGTGVFTDGSSHVNYEAPSDGTDHLIIGGLSLADLDEDGDTDFMVVQGGTPNAIYLNDGSGNFGRTVFPELGFEFEFEPANLIGGDADNDGHTDIIALRNIFTGDGNGNYTHEGINSSERYEGMFGAILRNTSGGNPLIVGVQFVFLDQVGQSIKAFRFHDDNGFLDVTSEVLSADPRTFHARNLYVADFDGNGTDDLFVADHGFDNFPYPGAQNTLLLQQPDGTLIDGSSRLPQVSDFTHDAAIGDIDGDGDIDIYASNLPVPGGAVQPPYFMINDGSGNFTLEE